MSSPANRDELEAYAALWKKAADTLLEQNRVYENALTQLRDACLDVAQCKDVGHVLARAALAAALPASPAPLIDRERLREAMLPLAHTYPNGNGTGGTHTRLELPTPDEVADALGLP